MRETPPRRNYPAKLSQTAPHSPPEKYHKLALRIFTRGRTGNLPPISAPRNPLLTLHPHSSTPMFGAIVNRPNHVQAKQIAYQAEKVPVYLRGNGKYYYRAYLAFLGVSFVGAHFQLFQYMRGKANKNE
ncbi:hypothetical protein C364_06389 [Cryptococcus neoformans Bt63]|nr:hypothetical protein C364_06389 [Cryptococcus neoformans var. grubii Bt63]